MNVLSLFDGCSGGQMALNRQGIKYSKYYASEIDKYAIKVTQANYPNTVQLGDIREVKAVDLPKIGLILAGSPCQGFSFAGKQLNFDDDRSKLFFEFIRLLEEIRNVNPDVKFLLENVKMKKEYEAVISRFVGIDPIEINSSLLSAQSRKRLYWTNIGTVTANLFGIEEPGIKQPKDKGILLKDILELNADESFYLKVGKDKKKKKNQVKAGCLTAGGNSGGNHSDMDLLVIKCTAMRGRYKENGKRQDSKGSIAGKSTQEIEIRKDFKTNCLTSVQKDNILMIREKSKCVRSSGRLSDDRHEWDKVDNLGILRRLTPIECERLQTVPDNYTNHVSDSQRYKILGNGWTIDVICYILSHM